MFDTIVDVTYYLNSYCILSVVIQVKINKAFDLEKKKKISKKIITG